MDKAICGAACFLNEDTDFRMRLCENIAADNMDDVCFLSMYFRALVETGQAKKASDLRDEYVARHRNDPFRMSDFYNEMFGTGITYPTLNDDMAANSLKVNSLLVKQLRERGGTIGT